MPIAAELRASLYNTPAWRELSRRLRDERAGGRCECRGQCGKHHSRQPGSRCVEVDGAAGVEQRGIVRLTLAHRYQSETGRMVDESRLDVLCCACHLRWDQESHLAARKRNRLQVMCRELGQRDLWEGA